VLLGFSYQGNLHGCEEHGETLVTKIIIPHCSKCKGQYKKTNEGTEIPVEPVCVIFRSESEVYVYAENLSYI